MFLLDTNVVSELRKVRSAKAAPAVAAWAAAVPSAQMFISVITLHELEGGVLLAERADPKKGRLLRAWSEGELALGVTCDPPAASDAGWLHAALADELACVAAWLDRNAPRVRLLRCDGVLVSALPALPAPSSRRYIS